MSDSNREKKARRERGDGGLFRKHGNQTWTIQYYREGIKTGKDGQPIRARICVRESTGLRDRAKAKRMLDERMGQAREGTWSERERRPTTVDDLYASLREHYEVNAKAKQHGEGAGSVDRSVKGLGWRWKHLLQAFGGVLAANLTSDAVERYKHRRLKEGAAPATVNRELAVLRRMLNFGHRATPPKVKIVPYIALLKENNVRKGFVEDSEFRKLTGNATELWLRTFLELGYTYGWRSAELLGLRVRQVNLEQRTIRLDTGTTKNGEGREVAMTAKVAELLRAAIAGKKAEDFVLTRSSGRRVRDFRRAWWNLCTAAGLGSYACGECGDPVGAAKCAACGSRKRKYSGLIPHDLRRSAAKSLRRAGVPESVIMDAGGWKTPSMFRRYAIVSSADQREAVEALERSRARDENSTCSVPNQLSGELPTLNSKVQ